MKIIMFIIALFTYSMTALAGGTDYREISWLSVEEGSVYIKTTPSFSSDFCGDSTLSATILKIEKDSNGFNEMYSMALASFMSGQPIRFYFKECSNSPWQVDVVKVYSSQIGQH